MKDRPSEHGTAPEMEERARHKRIIRAAEQLFRTAGFRGVTMEAVARDAAVAKATLYSYYRSKDELFVAVSSRMSDILLTAFTDELRAAGRSVDRRVAAALIDKHRRVFALIRTSPHAQDLLSHKDQLAGDIFARLEETMLQLLTVTLREDPRLAPAAERLARALFFGTGELASRSHGVAELEADLNAFVTVHLAGARALARRAPATPPTSHARSTG
jgi:AcrR family transcriptional regulator